VICSTAYPTRLLDDLPAPQRHAVEVALLRAEPATSRSRCGGGAGRLVLRTLSAQVPIVVAIDDVQWLDGALRAALEFSAAIGGERAGVLLARRGHVDEQPLVIGDTMLAGDRPALCPHRSVRRHQLDELLRERLG
jgi:hypothetical protein